MPDELKSTVASEVKHAVRTSVASRLEQEIGLVTEINYSDNLSITLKVYPPSGGPRYFEVRVKEVL